MRTEQSRKSGMPGLRKVIPVSNYFFLHPEERRGIVFIKSALRKTKKEERWIHMTKHPGRFSLLALVLFLFVSAVPAHAASYPDLPASHWAYEDMDRAAGLGILSGVGGGRMAPADPLTWGQYLAMLTRTFAPEDYDGAVAQGLAWDRAGYQAACDSGLLTEDDFLPVDGDDLSGRICR